MGGVLAVMDALPTRAPRMMRLQQECFRGSGTADVTMTAGPLDYRYFAEAHFTPANVRADETWRARFCARLVAIGVAFEERGTRIVVHGFAGHRLTLRAPEDCQTLLRALGAHPWLLRHHELVLEAAEDLISALAQSVPTLSIDHAHVRLAAGLHDAGKIAHPSEMHAAGHAHEAAGEVLLLDAGVEPRLARACVTHAAWSEPRAAIEDRLVALADALWKGKRREPLEAALTMELARAVPMEPWAAFTALDAIAEKIAARGPERLGRSAVLPT